MLRAPIAGIATQVDNIQLGRFVTAGTPVFSVIDDSAPWVDANPKETDITYLRVGQQVTIDVDSFPDHTFHGTVVVGEPRHRRAVLDPAAAERQRQLGQGRAARAGAHRLRRGRGHALLRAGMSVDRRDRHRPQPAAAFFVTGQGEAPSKQ